jgi:hypothetical protein
MKVSDLTVEVRSGLTRVGQILPADLIGLQLALRFNKVGAWKITLRSDHPLVDTLRAPGAGLIVTAPTGVILSGPTTSATNNKSSDDPVGSWDIVGADDSVVLGERLAYPVPSTDDLYLQTSAYDTRTGAAETVVKAYVNANIGPSAPTARKITGLTIDTDLGRGATVTGNARFESLGALAESLLLTSGLGFDVVQSGSTLVFKVFAPTDRSGDIRMDVDNLRLESSSYSYTRPDATRVIVAGQGSGSQRVLIERSSTDSTTAETAWGRRIEVFKDERSTTNTTALQQAGDELLADKGRTVEGISVKPSDDQTMRYGVDWGLGDKVTIVVGSSQVSQIVTEVAIVITEDGVKVGATVGDPAVAASSDDTETQVLETQSSQDDRISALERNDTTTVNDSQVTTAKLADGSVTSAKIDAGGIATSKVTGLDTALAAKAPLASPTFTGTTTAPLLRLTNTDDASASSTLHALQIGDSAGANVRIDGNEILAVNNGVVASLNLQADGGTLNIGGTTAATVNLNASRMTADHYPYAMSAGTASVSVSSSSQANVAITFPSGRFTATPIVTITQSAAPANSQTFVPRAIGMTSSGFSAYIYSGNNTVTTFVASFHWHAVQMTSTTGAG